MSFDNPSNHSRVSKMLDALDKLEKSGKSNRATPMQYAALLAGVQDRVKALTGGVTLPQPKHPPHADVLPSLPGVDVKPATGGNGQSKSQWQDIDDMINSLDAKDLDLALSKIAVRIGDYFHERGYK